MKGGASCLAYMLGRGRFPRAGVSCANSYGQHTAREFPGAHSPAGCDNPTSHAKPMQKPRGLAGSRTLPPSAHCLSAAHMDDIQILFVAQPPPLSRAAHSKMRRAWRTRTARVTADTTRRHTLMAWSNPVPLFHSPEIDATRRQGRARFDSNRLVV